MELVTRLSKAEKLSGRFPYALAALLEPYDLRSFKDGASSDGKIKWAEDFSKVVRVEFLHVLERQGAGLSKAERDGLLEKVDAYLESEGVMKHPVDFINLFLAETFINRERKEM